MLAETGEEEAIRRPPRRPLDLALEDAELVPENQKLKSELGLGVTPIDKGIEEWTEDGVEKSENTVRNPGTMTHLSDRPRVWRRDFS